MLVREKNAFKELNETYVKDRQFIDKNLVKLFYIMPTDYANLILDYYNLKAGSNLEGPSLLNSKFNYLFYCTKFSVEKYTVIIMIKKGMEWFFSSLKIIERK